MSTRFCALLCSVVTVLSTLAAPALAQLPLNLADFSPGAPQGFGDPNNTFFRAMQWWQGRLYVGVQRSYACTQTAILSLYVPGKSYPPDDATIDCTADWNDLPLQGEIWRWTPAGDGPGTWERVFQSPNDVPIPFTSPQKFTARDIGFRDMTVFVEPDGTEALYVAGTTARGFIPKQGPAGPSQLPPPRLLRSVDGETFTPVPQAPGTVLGGLTSLEGINISSFNRMTVHAGRLYVVAGGDFGHGVVFESADPAGGNDNFTRITPAGMTVTYMASFNNALYVAQGAQPIAGNPPFQVLKTTTGGPLPYTFTTIVTGQRLPTWLPTDSSQSIANMEVVGNALWVGSNQPPELIRINPNDTWDLFMGEKRQLADGSWKYPLTGMGDGFDWWFNIHIHRMQAHDGYLYAATNDLSNLYPMRNVAGIGALFGSRFGFDLYRTREGWYYYPITINGFEDKDPGGNNNWFNFTGRVAASTPYGLFFGTGNEQFGAQIWRGVFTGLAQPSPLMLEGERLGTGVALTWGAAPGATSYRIFRADYAPGWQLGVPFYAGGSVYPRPFTEIGSTAGALSFTDPTPVGFYPRQYYVIAEGATGVRSDPSNVVRAPSLLPAVTHKQLVANLKTWQTRGELSTTLRNQLTTLINSSKLNVLGSRFDAAQTNLAQARALASTIPASWRATDLQVLIVKLSRRVELARAGAVSIWVL
jgi:hypothetical protein